MYPYHAQMDELLLLPRCCDVVVLPWEVYGRSMGGVWEVLRQHLPCLKPFVHRCFSHIMGGVASFRPNDTHHIQIT